MKGRWPFALASFAQMFVGLILMLMAMGSGNWWYGIAALVSAWGSGETWQKGRSLAELARLIGPRK